MRIADVEPILLKYDAPIRSMDQLWNGDSDGRSEIEFTSKKDLSKIVGDDEKLKLCRHNSSPSVGDFLKAQGKLYFDVRVNSLGEEIIDVDVDTVYIPVNIEQDKYEKILNRIGHDVDSIEEVEIEKEVYKVLWWD